MQNKILGLHANPLNALGEIMGEKPPKIHNLTIKDTLI